MRKSAQNTRTDGAGVQAPVFKAQEESKEKSSAALMGAASTGAEQLVVNFCGFLVYVYSCVCVVVRLFVCVVLVDCCCLWR